MPGFTDKEAFLFHPSGIYSHNIDTPFLCGNYALLRRKDKNTILTFYIVSPFVFYTGDILYKWDVDFKLRSMCLISNYGLNHLKNTLEKQMNHFHL